MTDATPPGVPARQNWWLQIITGKDNTTVAWGRVFGGIVFLVFMLLTPPIVALLICLKIMAVADAVAFLDELKTYLPLVGLCAAGFVAGTYFTEPKPRGDGQ